MELNDFVGQRSGVSPVLAGVVSQKKLKVRCSRSSSMRPAPVVSPGLAAGVPPGSRQRSVPAVSAVARPAARKTAERRMVLSYAAGELQGARGAGGDGSPPALSDDAAGPSRPLVVESRAQ